MDIYETIRKMLVSNKVVDKWAENFSEAKSINNNEDENIKEKIIQYLNDKGLPLTQDNFDLATNMLLKNKTINYETSKRVIHTELENVDDECLTEWIRAKTLVLLSDIYNELVASNYMNYDVDVINDTSSGEVNEMALKKSLSQHSKNGWKVKSITTNELGKSEKGGTIGSISASINATRSQIVIIYERPITLNDRKAQKITDQVFKEKI